VQPPPLSAGNHACRTAEEKGWRLVPIMAITPASVGQINHPMIARTHEAPISQCIPVACFCYLG
jgi:hypothetical protein